MRNLPDRVAAYRYVYAIFSDANDALIPAIIRAYADRYLQTREEFIATLDIEKAARQAWYRELNPIPEIKAPSWNELDELERDVYRAETRATIATALGEVVG